MPCADLIVDLSPPDLNQEVSPDLSPSAYIHDPKMLSPLQLQASLEIGPKTHKRCTLEPPPMETDRTILQYYNRVNQSVSKEMLSVRIPGEGIVKSLNDGREFKKSLAEAVEEKNSLKTTYGKRISELEGGNYQLEGKVSELEGKVSELEGKVSELEGEISQLEGQIVDLRMGNDSLLKLVTDQNNARMKMFKANILVDLVKKVFADLHLHYPGNLEEVKETKKTRYAQAARSLNQQQLEAFFKENGKQLAPQYYKVLQTISQYIDNRNETAHESHVDFAVLLESDLYSKKKDYYKWANLFSPIYGKTVKEIVAEKRAAEEDEQVDEEVWLPAQH